MRILDSRDPASTVHRVFGLLLGYFALQVFLRLALSGSLEIDEAEQLIVTQDLRLVYSSDPPLYNWLQSLAFALFGANIFALAFTKNLLLAGTYVFTFLSARAITRDDACGLTAMLSLLLLPAISWGSQRTLTHSVALTLMAAATLWVLVRLLRQGRARDYALLGMSAGLGLLAKYNFVIFIVPLLLAVGSMKRYRKRLLDRRLLLSALTLILVLAPHLYGVFTEPQSAMAQADQLGLARAVGYYQALVGGVGDLLQGFVSHLGFLLPVYLLIFYKAPRVRPDDPMSRDFQRLLGRALVIALAGTALALVLLRIPEIKTRWLQPLMVIVPVYAVAALRGRIDQLRLRRVAMTAAGAAIVVTVLLVGRVVVKPLTGDYVTLNAPFRVLAAQLRQQGFTGGVIISDKVWIAGNLRLFFPDSIGIAPGFPRYATPPERPWLVIWEGDESDGIPHHLKAFVRQLRANQRLGREVESVSAPYLHSRGVDSMRLAYVIVQPATAVLTATKNPLTSVTSRSTITETIIPTQESQHGQTSLQGPSNVAWGTVHSGNTDHTGCGRNHAGSRLHSHCADGPTVRHAGGGLDQSIRSEP